MLVERTAEDLSALIMRGHHVPGVKESHATFLSRNMEGGYSACALGLAYVGLVGDPQKAHFNYYSSIRIGFSPLDFFAREFGVPVELAKRVSDMHCTGILPARFIAQVISPWTIVKNVIKKPTLYQRLINWLFGSKPQPQLRLVTNP